MQHLHFGLINSRSPAAGYVFIEYSSFVDIIIVCIRMYVHVPAVPSKVVEFNTNGRGAIPPIGLEILAQSFTIPSPSVVV